MARVMVGIIACACHVVEGILFYYYTGSPRGIIVRSVFYMDAITLGIVVFLPENYGVEVLDIAGKDFPIALRKACYGF